jgi:hypothetical protein
MLFLTRRLNIQGSKALTVLMLCACSATLSAGSYDTSSNSKRIEVYSLSQNYWDTQRGDTLSSIVFHLLPNNPSKRTALQQDILHLNPGAFIGGDPARLLAGKRLWLPGYMKQPDSKVDPATTQVETFSWGNIKRPRE